MVHLEFLDESSQSPDGSNDDELPTQSTRIPAWLVALVVTAVAAIAVVVLAQGQHDPKRSVAVPLPVVSDTPAPPPSAIQQMLAAVYENGRAVAPAHDIVRGGSGSGTCKLVKVGASPQQAASEVLRRELPGYRIVDTARIIDQDAGLCGLQVRARDRSDDVAIVMVTSPSLGPTLGRNQILEAHAGSFDKLFVEYAQFTTRDGWTVVVGTSGAKTTLPSTTVLGEVAASPALRW
jgi:hypothetical protein